MGDTEEDWTQMQLEELEFCPDVILGPPEGHPAQLGLQLDALHANLVLQDV